MCVGEGAMAKKLMNQFTVTGYRPGRENGIKRGIKIVVAEEDQLDPRLWLAHYKQALDALYRLELQCVEELENNA
jgi:hypothetical protein